MISFNLIISILAIIFVVLMAGVSVYYGNSAFDNQNDKIQKKSNKNVNQMLPKWKRFIL